MKLLNIMLVLLFTLIFIITGCNETDTNAITAKLTEYKDKSAQTIQELTTNQEALNAKLGLAETIAVSINNAQLTPISPDKIQSYEDYKKMTDKINLVIKAVNKHYDQEFNPLSTEREAYEQFTKTIEKYSPLINNYNELVTASKNFRRNDEKSADKVIFTTAGMGVELFLIQGGTLHKLVFTNIGEFSARIGLLRLSKICGPCVGAAMESLYWSSKNFIVDKGGELFNYFSSLNH